MPRTRRYSDEERCARQRAARRRYKRSVKGQEAALRDGTQGQRNLRSHLRIKFGMTEADVERLYADQSGLCACCMEPISLIVGASNIRCVDHNHMKEKGAPGFIRGLLCRPCNVGLGGFRDNVRILHLAIKYLLCSKAEVQ